MKRLRELRPQIEKLEARSDALYAERLALFVEGRAQDPPLIQREMGDAAGVTESAVIRTIKRAEARIPK